VEFNALEGNDWFITFFLGLPSLFPHLTSQCISHCLISRNEEILRFQRGKQSTLALMFGMEGEWIGQCDKREAE